MERAPTPAAWDAGAAQGDAAMGGMQEAGASDSGLERDASSPLDAGAPERDAALGAGGMAAYAGDAGGDADAGMAAADSGTPFSCPGATNACGGCMELPAALGSACGGCGLGSYGCDGADALSCTGGTSTPTTSGGPVLVDDFEDGDVVFRAGPFNGGWFLVSDNTVGTLSPAKDAELPTSPGANGVGALHASGSGFSDWGAGVQASLTMDGCYLNAAAQSGLRFSARGTGTVLFSVATKQTVPSTEGGSCVGNCYDNFATSIVLTNTWQSFPVPWSALHQAGWGTAASFEPSQIKYLQFSFAAGSSMNLYLDDVSFY